MLTVPIWIPVAAILAGVILLLVTVLQAEDIGQLRAQSRRDQARIRWLEQCVFPPLSESQPGDPAPRPAPDLGESERRP